MAQSYLTLLQDRFLASAGQELPGQETPHARTACGPAVRAGGCGTPQTECKLQQERGLWGAVSCSFASVWGELDRLWGEFFPSRRGTYRVGHEGQGPPALM